MRTATIALVCAAWLSLPGTGRAAETIAAGPLPPEILSAAAPPAILLGQEQRRQIGIKNGPDSIVDLWTKSGGESDLVFSGALMSGLRGTFAVPVAPTLDHVLASEPRAVSVFMAPRCGIAADHRDAAECQDFDSNYAGGGTIFPCPDGRILYFYHGENHTDPTGRLHHGPAEGWTGIGMAVWDPQAQKLTQARQVIGLNASNRWEGGNATRQGPPISGNPSAVLDPTRHYIYLYYTDRTEDPAYAGGPLACDRRPCTAVARADASAACAASGTASAVPWRKYYHGDFSEPALFQTASSPALPRGTGGQFTPLYPRFRNTGENVPNVTYLASRRLYVMIALQQPGGAIIARYSADGLRWSEPASLVTQPAGPAMRRLYPRLEVVRGTGGGAETYVLTYVEKSARSWDRADLLRLPMVFGRHG
jgi:hypothetical protein